MNIVMDARRTTPEPAAAKIMWNRSVKKYGLRYSDMACDGDSKAYNDVWDVYGICGDCEKFENMKKKCSRPTVAKFR